MSATSTTAFDLERVRDLSGRHGHVWYRRVALTLMTAFVAAALAGAFGQNERTRTATNAAAALSVRAPSTIRGGLLWPARITVRAREKIAAPVIVLGSGFSTGMQVNTIEPAATSETTRPAAADGTAPLALSYPTLEAGDTLTLTLQLQVNPTTVGEQDTSVRLEGAGNRPVTLAGSLTVLP